MKRLILLLLVFLALMPGLEAKKGHITLLTVSQPGEENIGGTADLFLEIKEGSGRIYIDSLPLSQLDTQISMRFGQELACSLLNIDCNAYDFFYTIRADSYLVKGPSAGASVAVLTTSLLADIPLKEDVVMTGTINSGGLIGPVSGINYKAEAARDAGFKKILVPKFELPPLNPSNSTVNMSFVKGIEVVKVGNLDEAMYEFTGVRIEPEQKDIVVLPAYSQRMQALADDLCKRTQEINSSLTTSNESMMNLSNEKHGLGIRALEHEEYYSAASFCFSANILLRRMQLADYTGIEDLRAKVAKGIIDLNRQINSIELKTLSDLETYMIVVERLKAASESIDKDNVSSDDVAYAAERYYSAQSWAKLFGIPGTALELDRQFIKEACIKKIGEAEERLNFVNLYVSGLPLELRSTLDAAYNDQRNGNYEACIFRAAIGKAEANMLVSSITIPEDLLQEYVSEKLDRTRQVIVREQDKGLFPLLGYSYYEYANSLKQDDPLSALTFSEYALEMSNLDMYFPKKRSETFFLFERQNYFLFLSGLLVGFGFCFALFTYIYLNLKK